MPPEDFLERDASRRMETLSTPAYYALQNAVQKQDINFSALRSLPPGYSIEDIRRKLGIDDVCLKASYSHAGFPVLGAYVRGSDALSSFNFAEINPAFKEIIYDYIWSKNPKIKIEDLVDISRRAHYRTEIGGFTFDARWAFPPVSAPSSPAFPGAPVQERSRLYRQEYDEYANHFITFLLEHCLEIPKGRIAECTMEYWIHKDQASIYRLERQKPNGKFTVSATGRRVKVQGFCREYFLNERDPDSLQERKTLEFTENSFYFLASDGGAMSGNYEPFPKILADYALHPKDGMVGEMAELGFMDDVLERE